MHEKLSFQIPAAVLSIKSRRLCDFAVCSALLEGQKVEIFKEEKKKIDKVWNSKMSQNKSKQKA